MWYASPFKTQYITLNIMNISYIITLPPLHLPRPTNLKLHNCSVYFDKNNLKRTKQSFLLF